MDWMHHQRLFDGTQVSPGQSQDCLASFMMALYQLTLGYFPGLISGYAFFVYHLLFEHSSPAHILPSSCLYTAALPGMFVPTFATQGTLIQLKPFSALHSPRGLFLSSSGSFCVALQWAHLWSCLPKQTVSSVTGRRYEQLISVPSQHLTQLRAEADEESLHLSQLRRYPWGVCWQRGARMEEKLRASWDLWRAWS